MTTKESRHDNRRGVGRVEAYSRWAIRGSPLSFRVEGEISWLALDGCGSCDGKGEISLKGRHDNKGEST